MQVIYLLKTTKQHIMAAINFFLRGKSSLANIYVRIGNTMTKTNFVISPDDWSKTKQSPKNLKNAHFKNLDIDLQELRTEILMKYNARGNDPIDINWLKKIINPDAEIQIPQDIISYMDLYLDERKNEITQATKKKLKVVQNKLKRLQKSSMTTFYIKDVNMRFKNTFFEYCQKEGYAENTIYENLKEIKTVCRHAQKKGIVLSKDFDDIRTPQKKAISVFLNFEELKKIEETELKFDYLQNARDWLLISCYTAQRVSDFMRFDKQMIREQEGQKLIEFTQKKTGKTITLPLHPKVLEILEKRKGNFPRQISSQNYNSYIKKVCEIAKIEDLVYGGKMEDSRKVLKDYPKHELITSHIGRRSFATNFYGIIPTSLLISATGHSTEQMFLVYIGKSNSDKAMQLSKYF